MDIEDVTVTQFHVQQARTKKEHEANIDTMPGTLDALNVSPSLSI